MKKSLILSAALFAAFGMNADVVEYDFNTNPPLFQLLQTPEADGGFGWDGTYDLIDKYGKTVHEPNGFVEEMIYKPEGAAKGIARANRIISLADGCTYLLEAEENDFGYEVASAEILAQPFLSWGEKGIARTIWDPKLGSADAWKDENYNAATEADWVSSTKALTFNRIGTLDMVSRGDTYVQFPEVQGPAKVTVYAGSISDAKSNKDQALRIRVTPIVDGVVGENVLIADIPADQHVTKRYYKKEYSYDGTGKVAFRVGPEDQQLFLMHVTIESAAGGNESGIADIIVNETVENAPVYNLLGVQVDETYKGIVIKNGKKFVQK